MGIEPTCSAWKADILPLNYTCDCQTFVNQPLKYITERADLSRDFLPKVWKNYLFFKYAKAVSKASSPNSVWMSGHRVFWSAVASGR